MKNSALLINGIPVTGKKFAYDGCHKIYVIEDEKDEQDAKKLGYTICPLSELENIYKNSCDLRFISNWKLNTFYANQYEKATFIWV